MTLLCTLYGRLEDCLSPGVQDQPAHYKENLLKKERREKNGERRKGEKEGERGGIYKHSWLRSSGNLLSSKITSGNHL